MFNPWCPNCQLNLSDAEVVKLVFMMKKRNMIELWAQLDALRVKEGWGESILRTEQGDQTQVQSTSTFTIASTETIKEFTNPSS